MRKVSLKDLKEEVGKILSTSTQDSPVRQLLSLFRCPKNWSSVGSGTFVFVLSL